MALAFTGAEKAKIRRWLGYSENFSDWDNRLESQLSDFNTRNPDATDQTREYLAQLDAIWAKLNNVALNSLEIVRAEDIVFLGPEILVALREQGRMLVEAIATTFNIDVERDVFGGSAGSSGVIPLG